MAHGTGDGSAWMGNHAAQQADDEVSDSGEHLGAMAFAHLGSVLVESDVAHPMQAVLDAPVAAVERQQLAGAGVVWGEVGDEVGPLGGLCGGFRVRDLAFDLAGLADVGEVEIAVERGGGADRALLDAPMGLIDAAVLRGGWIPSGRRRSPRPGFSGCL